MERDYPDEETGKIELQRILNCLKENKYDMDSLDAGKYDGCYNVKFKKEIMYSDKEGTYINDRHINVTIEFDTSFDYKTEYIKDRNGDFQYNSKNADKAQQFIEQLMDDTYASSKKGGRRKQTRKNKKRRRITL
jgi:hypothetical protein